jgi:hypothetical protein
MALEELGQGLMGLGLEDRVPTDRIAGVAAASTTAASGMPRSTTASPACSAQIIQASMPAWGCSDVPWAICSTAVIFDR